MIIMVIQGTDGNDKNKVLSQLNDLKGEFGVAGVVTINVQHIADPQQRVEHLKRMIHRRRGVVNVIDGATSEPELTFLRQLGASFFTLCRSVLPASLLKIKNAIMPFDKLIVPYAERRGIESDVLYPDEAFSVCFLRHRRCQQAA
ncbi:hypothetical protein [Photobacterium leiognathi]|uniref:hypothetical protein n=1 Tax=Photobacterium leiognathi TaxID=553611 RepID=UPI00273839A1|nr:hypothetical protein [Photobacterium leiognathi]